jgi:hypothetical protein
VRRFPVRNQYFGSVQGRRPKVAVLVTRLERLGAGSLIRARRSSTAATFFFLMHRDQIESSCPAWIIKSSNLNPFWSFGSRKLRRLYGFVHKDYWNVTELVTTCTFDLQVAPHATA